MAVVSIRATMEAREAGGLGIRELSRHTGCTLRALRHYESLGLLDASRTKAGARRYSPDQRRRAAMIAGLRRLGMPLAEIRAALSYEQGESEQRAAIVDFIERQTAETEGRLQALREMRQAVDSLGLTAAALNAGQPARRLRHAG